MFCPYCGKEVSDKAAVCLGCGASMEKVKGKEEGKVSSGWWWLGFFVPIAGLIIWAVSNDSEPKKAKKAGIGALVGTITSVVLSVLIYVIYFAFIFLMMSY